MRSYGDRWNPLRGVGLQTTRLPSWYRWLVREGDHIEANTQLARFTGPARALLTGERTALNFIRMRSAVPSRTHDLAMLVKGTRARVFDTRETIPDLRDAQKYAVKVGVATITGSVYLIKY